MAHMLPYLAHALRVISQFMHNLKKQQTDALMRILRYVKSPPGKGVLFSKNGRLDVEAYIDAT